MRLTSPAALVAALFFIAACNSDATDDDSVVADAGVDDGGTADGGSDADTDDVDASEDVEPSDDVDAASADTEDDTEDEVGPDVDGDASPDGDVDVTCDDRDDDGICDSDDACPDDALNDSDGDGACDSVDPCPADNPDDSDLDEVCDAGDACHGHDDREDGDGDTVPDGCDVCAAGDDTEDVDGDEVPDACDVCPLDNPDDGDDDGLCDSDPGDRCIGITNMDWTQGHNWDQDAWCDDVDLCPDGDDSADYDDDGVPDGCDVCAFAADSTDGDGDLVPDGCDNCIETANGAQANSDVVYRSTVEPITFAPRPAPANLLRLADDVRVLVPLGFEFTFFGRSYDRVNVSSNGFISFDSRSVEGCCAGEPLDLGKFSVIAAVWTDLGPHRGGTVAYGVTGDPGEREWVLDCADVPLLGDAEASVTTQIVLREADNSIEIHTTHVSPAIHEQTQGVRSPNGSAPAFIEGRNSAFFSLTNDAVRFTTDGTDDTIGDACDVCPYANPDDDDTDNVCDDVDACLGSDDALDEDLDGAPDDCDICPDQAEYPAGSGVCVPFICEGVDCSGHGSCEDAGDGYLCSCETGYAGDNCESCDDGYVHDPSRESCIVDPCFAAGCPTDSTCDSSSGAAVCVCDPGYSGTLCDECVRFVDVDAPDGGDGLTWQTAFNRPHTAVAQAAGEVAAERVASCDVWIAEGTYFVEPFGSINLTSGVHMYGGFTGTESSRDEADPLANETIIDGRRSFALPNLRANWLAKARGTDVIVDGLIFQYGQAVIGGGDDKGAALAIDGAQVTIRDSVFRYNEANGNGGAVYVENFSGTSQVLIEDSSFHSNYSAGSGGALYGSGSNLTVRNSTFDSNAAAYGGAIRASNHIAMSDCTVIRNVADVGGGVLVGNMGDGSIIERTEFAANVATQLGGGAAIEDAVDFSFVNNVVTANTAEGAAGVFGTRSRSDTAIRIISSLISRNVCTTSYCGMAVDTFSPVVLNSIVWGNVGPSSTDADSAPLLQVSYSTIPAGVGTGPGVLHSNPQLTRIPSAAGMLAGAIGDTVVLSTATPCSVGDYLVFQRDGVLRRITRADFMEAQVDNAAGLGSLPAGAVVEVWPSSAVTAEPDFSPYGGSLCVDAGSSNWPAPSIDFFGMSRVNDPATHDTGTGPVSWYDIGPFEYRAP